MPTTTVDIMVEGGKATAGAKLGVALGPLKINVANVVQEINSKTKDFAGIQVPVKIIVETQTKTFEIVVGSPPTSQLIKKELNVQKGSGDSKNTKVGNLTFEQLVKIAKGKMQVMMSRSLKSAAKEIVGTCKSMGVTVEGKDPREVISEIDAGKYNGKLKD